MPSLLLLLEKLGPYHRFRLSNWSEGALTVLETRPDSKRYSWVEQDAAGLCIVGSSCSNRKEFVRLLERQACEVVFVTGYAFREMLWAVEWANHAGKPVCLLTDSTEIDSRRGVKEVLKKRLIRSFAAAVVAGTRSRAYLERLGMQNASIFEPYDVVDNDYFSSNKTVSDESPFFLCVSRLVPQKNLFTLIDAFHALLKEAEEPQRLIILGDGVLQHALELKIKRLNLDDLVILKGFLEPDEVKKHYHSALGLVLASTSEQWGLCINEAIAAGLPVIASCHAGATADLIEDGISGFTFSPYQASELKTKLQTLLALTFDQRIELTTAAKNKLKFYNKTNFQLALVNAANFALHDQRVISTRKILDRVALRLSSSLSRA